MATLRVLKNFSAPASQEQTIRDFEEICVRKEVTESSVIITLIQKWVKENRETLSKKAPQTKIVTE
jgi:hypothetical protein